MRVPISTLLLGVLLAAVPQLVNAQGAPAPTPCDPFVPYNNCQTTVDFPTGVHDIIAVTPGGSANVHVINKPAFSTCQLSFAPGPPPRSVDASVAAFLTGLSGIGLFAGNPPADRTKAFASPAPRVPPNSDAANIELQIQAVQTEETRLTSILDADKQAYKLGVAGDAAHPISVTSVWKETDERKFPDEVPVLKGILSVLILRQEPSIASLQAELDALSRSMGEFHRKYDGTFTASGQAWLDSVNDTINKINGLAARYQDYIADILAIRTGLKQALAQLPDPPYTKAFTMQDLPIPGFVNNNMSVTVSCKDNITQVPSPISVTFTAYYTRLPWLDFSAGPLFSLLGRHQVGVIGATAAQMAAAPTTAANGYLGVTDQSSFQVVPMAFVEFHSRGFRCPWANPKDIERRFGYVCSAGVALGAGPNNASGTVQAEFFEGVSFAIQRISFLVGFHDGRVEELGGGYGIGQPVPSMQ